MEAREEEEGFKAQQKKARKTNQKNQKKNKTAVEAEDEAELEAALEKRRQAEAALLVAGSTADGQWREDSDDDDPIFGKKNKKKGGKKGQQEEKKQRQGKKGKKGAAAQDDEEEEKSTLTTSQVPNDALGDIEEEKTEAVVEVDENPYPLQMVYCGKCGLPPEYCEWSAKGNDMDECKKWLAENHPDLYASLYVTSTEGEESKEGAEGGQKKKKKGKKVAFVDENDKKIRVIKQKRGGKKIVSSILGLEAYGCNLEDTARILSRKLGTGAAAMTIEYREVNMLGIQVQGDVSDKLEPILASEYNIPAERIAYEDGGTKKNRTMGNARQ